MAISVRNIGMATMAMAICVQSIETVSRREILQAKIYY